MMLCDEFGQPGDLNFEAGAFLLAFEVLGMSLLFRLLSQEGSDTAARFADCNQGVKQLFIKQADYSLPSCSHRTPSRMQSQA